jgi:hypothetical protein
MASMTELEPVLVAAFDEMAAGSTSTVTLEQARDGYLKAIRDLNSHYGVARFECLRQREIAAARVKRAELAKEQAERVAKERADREARQVLDTEAARIERIKRAEAHVKSQTAPAKRASA